MAVTKKFGFGMAPVKREGYTVNLETGESHKTTDAERAAASKSTETWMEIPVDPMKQSRAQIHAMVDAWINNYYTRRNRT